MPSDDDRSAKSNSPAVGGNNRGLAVLAVALLVLAAVAAVYAVRHGSAVRERVTDWIDPPPTTIQVDPPYAELPGGKRLTATWDESAGTWVLPAGSSGHRVFAEMRCFVSAADAAGRTGRLSLACREADGRGIDHPRPPGDRGIMVSLPYEASDGTISVRNTHRVRMGDGGATVTWQLRVKTGPGDPVMLADRTVRVVYSD